MLEVLRMMITYSKSRIVIIIIIIIIITTITVTLSRNQFKGCALKFCEKS